MIWLGGATRGKTCIYLERTKQKKKSNTKTKIFESSDPSCLLARSTLLYFVWGFPSIEIGEQCEAIACTKAIHQDTLTRCCLSTCSLAGGGPRPLSSPLSCPCPLPPSPSGGTSLECLSGCGGRGQAGQKGRRTGRSHRPREPPTEADSNPRLALASPSSCCCCSDSNRPTKGHLTATTEAG